MRPRDVVQAWVEAFNRADVDALSSNAPGFADVKLTQDQG